MLRVGLMAMGGSHWIAAVHNIHSLLYGNSLLPAGERGSLRLYLDYGNDHRSDYQSGSSSPVIWRSSPVAMGQKDNQAFSPAVTSSRLRAPAFNGIDSCSFLFPPIANQLDAIVLMRNLAAARQISAVHSGPSNTFP